MENPLFWLARNHFFYFLSLSFSSSLNRMLLVRVWWQPSSLLPTGPSQLILNIAARWNLLKSRLDHVTSLLKICKGFPCLGHHLGQVGWLSQPVTQPDLNGPRQPHFCLDPQDHCDRWENWVSFFQVVSCPWLYNVMMVLAKGQAQMHKYLSSLFVSHLVKSIWPK